MSERDRLFLNEPQPPGEFEFDDAVARVFPDMLRRSIPGYDRLLHLVGVHAAARLVEDDLVYDLGASLGAVTLSIRHALGSRACRIVAVDNSTAMVERCRDIVNADPGLCPVSVALGDVTSLPLEPCALVVMNFTLQFIPLEARASLITRIARALRPGGSLILSEKIEDERVSVARFFRETHDAFRQANGYSALEISRKRDALEEVLVPEARSVHERRMEDAGLQAVEWFRSLQFSSWVAVKA